MRLKEKERTDNTHIKETYWEITEIKASFPWPSDNFQPVTLGPAWQTTEQGFWYLPKFSLGWECLAWCQENLRLGGDEWWFTAEQTRLVLWWYAVDEQGKFLYDSGVIQRVKGWGKDPFGACLCLFELLGPCRFSHFGEWREQPIGKLLDESWVQTAAVSQDQTKNTMLLLPSLISAELKNDFVLNVGRTQVYSMNGSHFFDAVTSSPATLEGARATFVLKNETHHWKQANQGHAMSEVIGRNAAKSADGSARSLAITNAYQPGEDSVAERDRDYYLDQEAGVNEVEGFFYDSLEAPEEAPLNAEAAPDVCLIVRGDSDWLSPERMVKEILNTRVPESTRRRFWYNQVTASEDSWLASYEWGARKAPREIKAKEVITLGFDGSRERSRHTTDATAIVACAVFDKHVFMPLEKSVWEQPQGVQHWKVPAEEVAEAIAECFRRYRVVGFFADPAKWEGWVAQWEAQYGSQLKVKASQSHPIEWWMTGGRGLQIVRVVEQFHNAVMDGELTHDGNLYLSRHILNARNKPTTSGMQIAKAFPDSADKIDAAIAAVLAYEAAIVARSKGIGVQKLNSFVPRRI